MGPLLYRHRDIVTLLHPFSYDSIVEQHGSLSQYQATPSRSREAELLACLSNIDKDINIFVEEVALELNVFTNHRQRGNQGRPSRDPRQNSESLQGRLDTIFFKSPAVKHRKECIEIKLAKATESLKSCPTIVGCATEKIEQAKTPSKGVPFDTGKLEFNFIQRWLSVVRFKPITTCPSCRERIQCYKSPFS